VPGPEKTRQDLLNSKQGRSPALDCVFRPRSMAVAGLSPDPHGSWLNQVYVDSPVDMGFKGPIYPINPKGGWIGSLQVCPSLKDVVGSVDYVVSCIPAHLPA
jgi:acyl-CoA synthetase (NDP forming)